MAPAATILITTRNRKEELRGALRSALSQDLPCEVLVIDDASTDGTAEMVRKEFPDVRLEVAAEGRGLIVERNVGARLASSNIIVSIDDDAVLTSNRSVRQILAAFDHPRVGIVSIPFIDVNVDRNVTNAPARPDMKTPCCRAFTGTAYAVRRDVFLKIGGYSESLFQFGEESDLAIRLLDAGYVVRVGDVDPIHHYFSPKRVISRGPIYRARNRMLWSWWNVPFPQITWDIAAGAWNILVYGVKSRKPSWSIYGLLRGVGVIFLSEWKMRRPVSRQTFRLWHRLKREAVDLRDFESELKPLVYNGSVEPALDNRNANHVTTSRNVSAPR